MRKLVPVLLIPIFLLLTQTLLLTGPTTAQEPEPPSPQGAPPEDQTAPPRLDRALFAKIEPQLLKTLLADDDPARFIVYLKTKADLAAVVASAQALSAQGQPDELARRTAIVNVLQQTAQDSQSGVLQVLNNSTSPGGLSGQSVATTDINSLWVINAVAAKGSLETVLALAARSEVDIIRLDREIKLNLPSVTLYQSPLLADPSANRSYFQSLQWGIAKIRADLVHNALRIDGSGVVVANIDSGVDWQHPALQAKYRGFTGVGKLPQHLGNWHDATGGGAAYPVDGNGHGTHTMGTMVGDNGVGVAPGARWIAVKAFNSLGVAQASWLHEAFQWLLAPNGDPSLAPDVVNNSWSNNVSGSTEFEVDVQALLNAAIYPIFSAGNGGPAASTVGSPGSLNISLAVGATTLEDEIANFSGRGPSPWGKIKPDVSAPGLAVVSTLPGGSYGSLNGTSMAAPHVAGLAALLLQASPALANNPNNISKVITSTTLRLGNPIPNNDYGWGRIEAYNAVMSVAGAGTIQGAVTQVGSGLPIAHASIRITPRSGGPAVSATSDAKGMFFQGVAADTYDVTASAFGYQPVTAFNIAVSTGLSTLQNFALASAPVGTLQGTVRDKNTNAPLAATITVPGTPARTNTNPADGSYRLTLPVGTYALKVVAASHRVGQASNITINDGATVTENFLLASAPSILLVDGGKWYQQSQIGYYRQALDDALFTYDLRQISKPFDLPSDVPISSTLSSYDIVIWSSPEDSPGYIGADAALAGFMKQGGKLLLSGQNVAFFDGGGSIFGVAPYLEAYLKTFFVQDNAETDTVVGASNGPLAGLSLTIGGGDGADNQTSPDAIANAAVDFAGPLLSYTGNQLAGLHIGLCVPYRALFLSFGFEAISSRSDRSQVISQAIDWLMQTPAPTGLQLTPTAGTGVGNFGSIVTHTIRVRNTGTNDDSYNLSTSSNWPVELAPPAQVAVESCKSQVVTLTVQVGTTDWNVSDDLTLRALSGTDARVTGSITRTTKSPAPVLLVDDDRFFSFAAEFQAALDFNNIPYDYWLVPKSWQGEAPPSPSLDVLRMYPVTVWYTAYDWFQPLTPVEENRLAAYLDGGGRLLLSSQDYIYKLPDNMPDSFAKNYLGILAHTENYSSSVVIGLRNNPVTAQLGPYKLDFPPGYGNATDALTPTNSAQVATIGEEGQPNGLLNTGIGGGGAPWRTVFLAYGPELIGPTHQAKLMQRAVGWLGWLGTSRTSPHVSMALNGDVVTYTATIVNDGWNEMTTAYFTATFPAELTINNYSPELTLSDGNLIWSGPLPRNGSKVFNYSATLADPLPIGSLVSQTNWLAYAEHDLLVDRVATVYVNFPDISRSTLTVVPTQDVEPGDVLTYSIVLKNSGLVDDPMVTTTTTLPHMLNLDTVNLLSSGDVVVNGRNITWTTALAKNELARLTYRTMISYRTSAPLDHVALVDDNINDPLILTARTWFEVLPIYFPLVAKP